MLKWLHSTRLGLRRRRGLLLLLLFFFFQGGELLILLGLCLRLRTRLRLLLAPSGAAGLRAGAIAWIRFGVDHIVLGEV